ncbi:MAG: flagellar biosynthesis protein FlhB [Dehalococcoidia bacterium]|nr:flagellar biosynthesis protein FlhB [Dehalococcoidia bacterium]
MTTDRTEAPTQHRLEDARRRGQVAHSREVDTAIVLGASLLVMHIAGAQTWRGMESLLRDSFAVLGRDELLTMELTADVGRELIWRGLAILLPLFLGVAALSILGGVLQTGFVLSAEAIKPQFSRLNPLQGAKRVFASKRSYVLVVVSTIELVFVSFVAYLAIRAHLDDLLSLGVRRDLRPSLAIAVTIAFDVTLKVCLALLAVAAADFVFQRMEWISQLRMTKQEVKDEHRQNEGDPQVKQRMARLRRSLMTRVLASVPQADVVLTNPTHYAVAIKYDPASDRAPRVLAKGQDYLAQRIREVAVEHRVPIMQNPPLTRAIFRAVPVNQEIPPDLYEAVAEVLAFVYRLRAPRRTAA